MGEYKLDIPTFPGYVRRRVAVATTSGTYRPYSLQGNEQDFGACQTVPFPCRSFSISSSIREGKVIQLCGPIRGLSKTAKVASIRVLVVEKKIIPRVLLARPFSAAPRGALTRGLGAERH